MAVILPFPLKEKQVKHKKRTELLETFATRLAEIMSPICRARDYHGVPITMICRAMANNMVDDGFDYSEAMLAALLDDQRVRQRLENSFMRMLRDNGYLH